MSQTVSDIIARVAYEVDDEYFRIINRTSMVKALDRVYREYCQFTKIRTSAINFKGDGVALEFDLNGPIDTGGTFGDNFFKLYRVEYQGRRAQEQDFEAIMNGRIVTPPATADDDPVNYAIKYLEKFQRMYFSFVPKDGDVVELWYYEFPRLGTINDLTQTFPIDDKNTDDLVEGLKVWAYKRMMSYYLKLMQSSPGNEEGQKDTGMVQFIAAELKTAKETWEEVKLSRAREFASYREEVTPTVMEISSPFEIDIDPSWETDYSGYDTY